MLQEEDKQMMDDFISLEETAYLLCAYTYAGFIY